MHDSTCDVDFQLLLADPATRQDAADRIYFKYTPALRHAASRRLPSSFYPRLGADDLLQSTWRSFHGCVAGLHITDSFWPYLFKILTRKIARAFETHLAAKRDVRLEKNFAALGQVPQADQQQVQWLRESVEELDGLYKQVIELRLAGYSQAEIASHLGTSVRFVQRYQQSAIETLRSQLDDDRG